MYLYLNRKVTEKKLNDYKEIIFFLDKNKIEYLIYSENKDNPLVKELIYKKNNKPKKNHLIYDVIIVKNKSFDINEKDDAYSLYWLYNLKNTIKIKLVSSFNNYNVLKFMKILDKNNCCAFEKYVTNITEKEKEWINKLENLLNSYKIEYHYATIDELYDNYFISDEGEMFLNKFKPYKREWYLLKIIALSNESLIRLGFEETLSYNSYPYTFCSIARIINVGIFLNDPDGKISCVDFFEFIYKINRLLKNSE